MREEKSLPVYLELLGDHPFTATLMEDMGASYQALGDYSRAVSLIREALRIRKQALGDHQETARSFHDLGKVSVSSRDQSTLAIWLPEDCFNSFYDRGQTVLIIFDNSFTKNIATVWPWLQSQLTVIKPFVFSVIDHS